MFEDFNTTISNLSKDNKSMSLPNALINLPFVGMVMYPIVFAYGSYTAIRSGGLNLGSFVENMNNFFFPTNSFAPPPNPHRGEIINKDFVDVQEDEKKLLALIIFYRHRAIDKILNEDSLSFEEKKDRIDKIFKSTHYSPQGRFDESSADRIKQAIIQNPDFNPAKQEVPNEASYQINDLNKRMKCYEYFVGGIIEAGGGDRKLKSFVDKYETNDPNDNTNLRETANAHFDSFHAGFQVLARNARDGNLQINQKKVYENVRRDYFKSKAQIYINDIPSTGPSEPSVISKVQSFLGF